LWMKFYYTSYFKSGGKKYVQAAKAEWALFEYKLIILVNE
jgi:hypothetical protein